MSNYDINPSPTQMLNTEVQIRAYVNPTRMTILTMLAQEKQSVSGVARQLKVHPANLTHHFKILEKTGLIKLVEKRETGKNLEKYYRAVAYHFTVALDDETSDPKVMALSVLRDNLDAALPTLKNLADDQPVLGVLKTVRIKPEALAEFQRKLLDLADEFVAQASGAGAVYSLNVSLYPTQAGNLPAQEVILRADEGRRKGGEKNDKTKG